MNLVSRIMNSNILPGEIVWKISIVDQGFRVDNLVSGQTLVELDKLQKKIVVTSQDAIAAGLR